MKNSIWYAVMRNRDDSDWGYGSHEIKEAIRMAESLEDDEAYIAVIDESKNDPFCIGEIWRDEDGEWTNDSTPHYNI